MWAHSHVGRFHWWGACDRRPPWLGRWSSGDMTLGFGYACAYKMTSEACGKAVKCNCGAGSSPFRKPHESSRAWRRSPSSRDCDTDFVADRQAPGLAHRGEQRFTPSLCHQRTYEISTAPGVGSPPPGVRSARVVDVSHSHDSAAADLLRRRRHPCRCVPAIVQGYTGQGTDHTRQTAAT